MTELFQRHGIQRPIDLANKAKLSRQYAHHIWTGKRGLSRKKARQIEAETGIPYAELMAAEPNNPPTP